MEDSEKLFVKGTNYERCHFVCDSSTLVAE